MIDVNEIDIDHPLVTVVRENHHSARDMADDIYSVIGAAIRARRDAIGMTQATLARLAGLSRTSITNIERGGQALLVHQLLELAKVLRVVDIQALLPNSAVKVGGHQLGKVTRNDVAGEEMKYLLERLETPKNKRRSK